jgi:phosphatidylglycerol lysyltransferase
MSADSRDRLLVLLKQYGWNATSFQVVETDFRYWFDSKGDAAVAFLDTGGAWVVAGAPIGPVERIDEIASRFAAEARRRRKRIAYFAVEPRFLDQVRMSSAPIGEQPWWDPRSWDERHRGHRGLKEQLRRARAKGVTVTRVPSSVAANELRPELERLIDRWLTTRVMPPMSFLVALEPFVCADERRFYVARSKGRAIGLLVAVPVYDRGGWFFEDILRDPQAPNGTTELMIDTAMRDVAADGCSFVTLGLAPLAGDAPWLRTTRNLMRGFYNFEGLRTFKAKLRPDGWTPIHLAWPADRTSAGAIYDALDAFAGGHIFRFGTRAVFRAPSPVLFLLGALLIPWIGILATAETKRWFRTRREQYGWVAFDAAMAGVLLSLSHKWRRPLAAAAGAAATADGVLTSISAARYGARRARGIVDALVIATAIAAPFTAAAIVFGGLRFRHFTAFRIS